MKTALAIALLACTIPASAAPHKMFYRNKYWWYGRAISAAVIVADALSTQEVNRYCPGCSDKFYFFNPRTSGTAAGAGAIGFGLSTLFSIGEYHFSQNIPSDKHVSGWHLAGYLAQPVTDAIAHGWAIDNNYSLAYKCRREIIACK